MDVLNYRLRTTLFKKNVRFPRTNILALLFTPVEILHWDRVFRILAPRRYFGIHEHPKV